MEMIPELKTETERTVQDQWGLDMQLVRTAQVMMCVATRRHLSKILQPPCITENGLHYHWSMGLQLEAVGEVRRRGVMASEEELGGGGGIGCGVRGEWGQWVFRKARGFQDITFSLLGIKELLREKNGHLKRISQSLDGGLGASNEEEKDSTIKE